MNISIQRMQCALYGIVSSMQDDAGVHLMYTLEHAYPMGQAFVPKVPAGTYTCVRGMHRLESMQNPFETFEVTGVPGHSNILFHKGNYNKDSEGCFLVGLKLGVGCILESKDAFEKLMDLQKGCDSFTLTVKN